MPLIFAFFKVLAGFLLSGFLAKLIISLMVNGLILGSMFLFAKNFSLTSLNYALSFFSFFGFDTVVNQIQYYWTQLPASFRNVAAYFHIAQLMGLFVNSYITSIFLAWICRRFG
jgi:hypothetical protein